MSRFNCPFVLLTLALSYNAMGAKSIDEVLQGAVDEGRVAGVVALAADSEKMLYAGAFGLADVAEQKPMRVNSVFRIASMTKPITSAAIMQLIERDQIALDTEASQYLPVLKNKLRLIEVTDGRGLFEKPNTQPNIAQLLSHTSGFGYEVWDEVLNDGAKAGLFTSMASEGHSIRETPLVQEPGTQWLYGISTDVLGFIVENVSAQSLEDYFQKQILQPLNMMDTSFNVPAHKTDRVATLHTRTLDQTLTENPNESFPPAKVYSGGGGLYSTGPDYVKFMQMILRNGELGTRILAPDSVEAMARNQIGDLEVGEMTTQWPGLSNSFDFFPNLTARFGYGFLINEAAVTGGRGANSLAWGGLYNTYFWIDPENDICGVVLAQVLPFFDAGVVSLLREFEEAVYSAPR